MKLRMLVAVAAALALAPSTAAATTATATIHDAGGDNGRSFERTPTDVRTVHVNWDGTTLRIELTYEQPPEREQLSLLMGDVFDEVRGDRCNASYVPQISVEAREGVARLAVPYVDGTLRADAAWSADGRTVAYVFTSPILTERFAGDDPSDPFACLSGVADGDRFLGAFDGRILRLTPAGATEALRAHLTRRFGARFTADRSPWLMCPRVAFFPPSEESWQRANCEFEFRWGRGTYRIGSVSFIVLGGRPESNYESRGATITKRLRRCRRFADLPLANARAVDRQLWSSDLVGCLDNGASMVRDLHYYRTPYVGFHGTNRAGFEDQVRFRCRRSRDGSRHVARCRNRLGDGFVYRWRLV